MEENPAHADPVPVSPFILNDAYLVHPASHEISVLKQDRSQDALVRLEPRIMKVLVMLAAEAGSVVSRQRLIDSIWSNTFVGEEALTQAVSRLRRVLKDNARVPRVIETIPKSGYRLVAAVSEPKSHNKPRRSRLPLRGLVWISVAASAAFLLSISPSQTRHAGNALSAIVALTDDPDTEIDPALSPDGRWLAYARRGHDSGNFDLHIRSTDSDSTWQLTNSTADDVAPAWSPDGMQIAFARLEGGYGEILTIPFTGGSPAPVYQCSIEPDPQLAWAPDGRQLILSDRMEPGKPNRMQLVNLGTGQTSVLTTPGVTTLGDRSPVFSRDGSQLAFLRMDDERHGHVRIIDWNNPVRRSAPLAEEYSWIHDLDWLDQNAVVFAGTVHRKHGIWRKEIATGETTWLGGEDAWQLAVNQSSDELVFVKASQTINLMRHPLTNNGDRSGVSQSLFASDYSQYNPALSPDGQSLAYLHRKDGQNQLWVGDIRTGTKHKLTGHSSGQVLHPAWSPDGQWLVYELEIRGTSALYRVPARGGNPRLLLGDEADNKRPTWSANEELVFISDRSGQYEAWSLEISTGEHTQLTSTGALFAMVSGEGQIYHSRPGRSSLWMCTQPLADPTRLPFCMAREDFDNWRLTGSGIHYVLTTSESTPALMYYSFDSHETRQICELGERVHFASLGFSLRENESMLYFASVGDQRLDLVQAELPSGTQSHAQPN